MAGRPKLFLPVADDVAVLGAEAEANAVARKFRVQPADAGSDGLGLNVVAAPDALAYVLERGALEPAALVPEVVQEQVRQVPQALALPALPAEPVGRHRPVPEHVKGC